MSPIRLKLKPKFFHIFNWCSLLPNLSSIRFKGVTFHFLASLMILSIGVSNQTQAQNLIIDQISQSVEVKRENLDQAWSRFSRLTSTDWLIWSMIRFCAWVWLETPMERIINEAKKWNVTPLNLMELRLGSNEHQLNIWKNFGLSFKRMGLIWFIK